MNEENIQSESILLDVGYESTTVETSEWISVKLKTSAYSSVWVEFVRGDKGWSSGKVPINEMGDVIEVNLMEGKSNSFSINAYDEKGNQKSCFPNELVIIQGTKVGNAVLPYNIGIATWDEQKQKAVFSVLQGLEKNKPLPAIGVRNGLKTTYNLRPNMKDDTIRIPVYQAEENSEGRSASIYEYVADVIITGEDVNTTIPENSNVDITLKVDSSEMMVMEVFFPSLDLTINKDLDTFDSTTFILVYKVPKDIDSNKFVLYYPDVSNKVLLKKIKLNTGNNLNCLGAGFSVHNRHPKKYAPFREPKPL